jgi:acrylyl-CoA reductase (NADPH)/3-hydroxypropionyl-CoA dehydratase/3-hydroxypropionyl-CoA synthetase
MTEGHVIERAPQAEINPVRTRADWEAMRAAVLADPGAFHGDIAARRTSRGLAFQR